MLSVQRHRRRLLLIAAIVTLVSTLPVAAQQPQRVTVLYDAFGASQTELEMDWGFAALVEYGGRRILFDTGNDARIFEHNVKQLGIDLTRLDAVVISHRHGDHTSGLSYLLQVNPSVRIYTPVARPSGFSPVPPGRGPTSSRWHRRPRSFPASTSFPRRPTRTG
jgi:7,8-dihydropterin-6-yl-methyl-4-(beta-D-ribofuranosyl)aminobenzene 5'-phosphate synthase